MTEKKGTPVRCRDCDNKWAVSFVYPMKLSDFIQKLKTTTCPKCGGREIYFDDDPKEVKPWN